MRQAGAHDGCAIGVRRERRVLLPRIEDLRDVTILDLKRGMAIGAVAQRESADQRNRPGVGAGRRRVVGQHVGGAEGAVLVRHTKTGLQIHLRHADEFCLRLVGDMGIFNCTGSQQKWCEAEQT